MSAFDQWGLPSMPMERSDLMRERRKHMYIDQWGGPEFSVSRHTHRRHVDIVVRGAAEQHVLRYTKHGAIAIVHCPGGSIQGQDLMWAMTGEVPCQYCMGIVERLRTNGPRAWSFRQGRIPDMAFHLSPRWRSPTERDAAKTVDYRMWIFAKHSGWTPPTPFIGRSVAHAVVALEARFQRALPDCHATVTHSIGPWSTDVLVDKRPFRPTAMRIYNRVPWRGLMLANALVKCQLRSGKLVIPVAHVERTKTGIDFIGFKVEPSKSKSHWHRGCAVPDDAGGWKFVRWYRNGGVE